MLMSRRDSIWFAAGALVATAVLFTANTWVAAHPARSGTAMTQPPMEHDKMMSQSSDNAGSLEEVTRKLAARLAANGGSDDEWKLLAQSYQFMGRTTEARAAQAHTASVEQQPQSAEARVVSTQELAAVASALDKH
jgi:cytochrome c-type biogenesis protein CcmH/NrfG